MNTPRQRDIISNVDQRTSSGSNHILTQTIAHRIGDECLVFEVPVLTKESTGDRFVLLQPILDVFPETVALRRSDKSPVQFLTTEDDLLMVPMRVAYHPGESLFIVPATTIIQAGQSLAQSPDSTSSHAMAGNNPFRTITDDASVSCTATAAHDESSRLIRSLSTDLTDPFGLLSFENSVSEPVVSESVARQRLSTCSSSSSTSTLSLSTLSSLSSSAPAWRAKSAQLLSQSTPLTQQPVPRLFIVLPDAKPRNWTDSMRPDTGGANSSSSSSCPRLFRLYFLCDCGDSATFPRSHMGPTATAQRHQRDDGRERARDVKDEKDIDLHNCIHVAEQPGYEVLNLAQFSEQFGEYALCLLRTLKYGVDTTQSRGCISQARIAVPSLTQSNYTDVLQPFTWEIVERVSFAIETLERMARTRQSAMTDETSVGSIDVSRLWECVDGLKSWGEYRVHFMRRMFVHDGTIRWICDRHFESTFEYTKEDRDLLLWRCREILGDDCSIDVGDEIGTLAEEADTLLNMSSSATQTAQEVTNEVSSVPTKPVSFDDREMHLTLSGLTSKEQIVQLASVLQTDAYMVQQVTLISRVSTEPLSMAIIDMMSKSKIPLWRVVFPPGARTKIGHGSTTVIGTPSSVPPPYSRMSRQTNSSSHRDSAIISASSPSSFVSSSSSPINTSAHAAEYTHGRHHHLCDFFVHGQIESLCLPSLAQTLFTGLMPDPGDFPHLRRLHLWGSDTLGNYLAVREREASDISPWNHVGLGSLVRAFSNLTDLRITGIFLGNSSPTAFSTSTASDPPVLEIAQSLLYLPKLAVLEISCCGLLKEHCALLSRSLSLLDNRITHLDVHNNWLEDEGLAELIWAAGPRLYSLDARNCGFGNASAFALMSMLQSHEQQNRRDLEDDGLVSQMAIYRVLKLEETCHPHKVLWPRKAEALTRTTFLKNSGTVNDLDEHGRQNMIRALELLEPMELGLSFELGFRDQDFASAFAGMKKLECLERLQVSHSNFGPLAVEAMLRTLRTTSCRIRELGIQSTLLTEEEQRATLDQILNI